MKKKSVAFIEPAGSDSNVFESYMRLPLMGTLYLGTILHNEGYDVRIYNENLLPGPIEPAEIQADVYCITALTVSAPRACLLASRIRETHPTARIIIGGIHASLLPDDFEDFADYVVFGEAEGIIVDLVEGRFDEKLVTGSPLEDLNSLPFVNYDLLEQSAAMHAIPMMTSRGCPFDCNFCSVTKIFGRRFRNQSPERVVAEIKHALQFFKTRMVFFYDDNFTASRKRVLRFCDLLEEEGLRIDWSTQVRSDVARDPQLVERMAQTGCRRLFIGFESVNDETLKAMQKGQTRSDMEEAIATIHNHGMGIHGMFIFGEDHDTPDELRATVDFAIDQNLDTVQFMILTPLPGTRVFENLEAEGRLLHRDWEYYNGMYAVFQPRNMSAVRLQEETAQAYRRFYSLRRIPGDALRLLARIPRNGVRWSPARAMRHSFYALFLKVAGHFVVSRQLSQFQSYKERLKNGRQKPLVQESPTARAAAPQVAQPERR